MYLTTHDTKTLTTCEIDEQSATSFSPLCFRIYRIVHAAVFQEQAALFVAMFRQLDKGQGTKIREREGEITFEAN